MPHSGSPHHSISDAFSYLAVLGSRQLTIAEIPPERRGNTQVLRRLSGVVQQTRTATAIRGEFLQVQDQSLYADFSLPIWCGTDGLVLAVLLNGRNLGSWIVFSHLHQTHSAYEEDNDAQQHQFHGAIGTVRCNSEYLLDKVHRQYPLGQKHLAAS